MKPITLGWIWLIACLPRLVLAAVFFNHPIALDDMYQYDMLARSIKEGKGYRWYSAEDFKPLEPYYEQILDVDHFDLPEQGLATAHRAPGYPYFLNLIYQIVPENNRFGWTRVLQALFTASIAPLTALIAFHSGLGRRTSRIAGVVAAFYPLSLFYPVALASENLFIPLLITSYLTILVIPKTKSIYPILLGGILLGASTLTRSVSALIAPISAWWLKVIHKRRWLEVTTLLVVAIGITIPWSIRNTQLFDKFTYIESSLGYNLFISYHPEGNGGFDSSIAVQPLKYLDDKTREAVSMEQALQFIREDPGEAVLRVFRKTALFLGVEDKELLFFYTNDIFGPIPQPWLGLIYGVLTLPWLLVLFLSPIGMFISKNRKAVLLALGLISAYTLPHLLIIAEPRFHLVLVPILLPYAVAAWTNRSQIRKEFQNLPRTRAAYLLLALVWTFLGSMTIWYFILQWPKLTLVMSSPMGHQLFLSY